MEIQVARFREVLELLKPAVAGKSTLPALEHVLLKDGKAVATDLDTMVIVPMPEADITCLIPFKNTIEMLKYIQGGETLKIEAGKKNVVMAWSEGKSSFGTRDPKEFPEIPEFTAEVEAEINSDMLIPAMVSVLPYVATEEGRPVLTGVTLTMGEQVVVAAGDGYRMAYQLLPLTFPQEYVKILHASSVRVLEHLWSKTPRTIPPAEALIPVIMAKKQVGVAFDGKTGLRISFSDDAIAIVKLLEGDPPAWLKLIPDQEPVMKVQIMASELYLAVHRVLKVAADSSKIIRMVFEDSSAIISAKDDDREIESSIKTFGATGVPNRLAINSQYLLTYLKGKEGIVSLSRTGESSPVMLHHQKDPRVLIMPMSANWGDSKDKPEPEPAQEADPAQEPDSAVTTEPVTAEVPASEPAPEPAQEETPAPVAKKKGRKKTK